MHLMIQIMMIIRINKMKELPLEKNDFYFYVFDNLIMIFVPMLSNYSGKITLKKVKVSMGNIIFD